MKYCGVIKGVLGVICVLGGLSVSAKGGKQYDFVKVEFSAKSAVTPQLGNLTQPMPNQEEIMRAVNALRGKMQRCANLIYKPAPPLRWSEKLALSAQAHADDMATYNYFEHTDRQGQTAVERAIQAGYPSRYVGENLGAGYPTLRSALTGWLSSTGHCQNFMNPYYTEVGIAYAKNPKSRWVHYWVMNLGGEVPVKIIYIKQ